MKLLKDIRAAVGKKVQFAGPDGWTPYSATAAARVGRAGHVRQLRGPAAREAAAKGKAFIAAFSKYAAPHGRAPPPYSVYQAQAAQIMLDAIAKSNGTRVGVNASCSRRSVKNGIMGTFHFDRNGDIISDKAISFDRIKGKTGSTAFVVILKVEVS